MASDYRRKSEEILLRSAEEEVNDEDEDEDLDSEDEYGPYMSGTLKFHTVPFTDHRGTTAYMVFQNLECFPLPPLFSFAVYFTHPVVTPENTDVSGLFEEIKSCNPDGFDVRFDMYFLPSATHEDCMRHYRDEKATRKIIWTKCECLNSVIMMKVHPLPGTESQIPGMVNQYHEADQVLYICSEKDWREGQHTLTILKFDRHPNTDSTPACRVEQDRPMTKQSPAYYLEDPSNSSNQFPVEEEVFYMAHRDRDSFLGVWQKATSRGRTGW